MPQPIRVRGVRALIAIVAVGVPTALSLTVLGSTAQAATPTKNTTYVDAVVDSDDPGSLKIKIGTNTNKIKKFTLVADCGATSEKLVLKNIKLTGGSFSVDVGPGQGIRGEFKNKHKVKGNFRTDLCGFFGGSFTAKD